MTDTQWLAIKFTAGLQAVLATVSLVLLWTGGKL